MRIFITECCRSFKTRVWNAMASENFPRKTSFGKRCPNSISVCCNIDFARISSPTRLRTLSILSASTRNTLSGPPGTAGAAAGSPVAGASLAMTLAATSAVAGDAISSLPSESAAEARGSGRDCALRRSGVTSTFSAIVGMVHFARICSTDLSDARAVSTRLMGSTLPSGG